jgi:sugar O-acyltransferase (sialic acid O-acetyltransferase NeuD family)
VIIGAGVFALEVLSWIEDVSEESRGYTFKGFLDDDVVSNRESENYLGSINEYEVQDNDVFVCSIASPKARLSICERLEARGAQFVTFVHPTARIDKRSNIGIGTVAGPFVYVGPGTTIGKHNLLNVQASIGHQVVMGDGCTLSSHTDITGMVQLGRGVYVGSHASILQKVKVGDFSTVGAGSVALRGVKEGSTVFGLPAKRISL